MLKFITENLTSSFSDWFAKLFHKMCPFKSSFKSMTSVICYVSACTIKKTQVASYNFAIDIFSSDALIIMVKIKPWTPPGINLLMTQARDFSRETMCSTTYFVRY